MPSHEKLQQSPHYPVLVTPNPMAKEQVRFVGNANPAKMKLAGFFAHTRLQQHH